jgi:methylphosphotriester-DNA--protein-cysteine methyltransferase
MSEKEITDYIFLADQDASAEVALVWTVEALGRFCKKSCGIV